MERTSTVHVAPHRFTDLMQPTLFEMPILRDGGSYYGAPTSKFLGWLLTVYIFYQLFVLHLKNRVTRQSRTTYWRLAISFYAASAAGNLLVPNPSRSRVVERVTGNLSVIRS